MTTKGTNQNREASQQRMERFLLRAPNLPTDPLVLLLAEGVIQNEHSGASDLERLGLLDQALALRILRLAGSAAYGGQPCATLGQAIMRTGFDGVAETLRIALKVNRIATSDRQVRTVFDELWTHSLLTGLAAVELMRLMGVKDRDRLARARLLGLIHDAGRMIFFNAAPEPFCALAGGQEQGHLGSPQREQKLFGFDHEDLGSTLARKWNLGTETRWVLGSHHLPTRAPLEFKGPALICLADWVALKCQEEWLPDLKQPDRHALNLLGLSPPDLRVARSATIKAWEQTLEMLKQAAPLRQ